MDSPLLPSVSALAPAYLRHRLEQTTLYSIVSDHYPRLIQEIERSGDFLPRFVHQEFEEYLKCGMLGHGLWIGSITHLFLNSGKYLRL